MDSLAVAAAVIQFVEFTAGLISKGIIIHSSLTGLTNDCEELGRITESLVQNSHEIKESFGTCNRQQLTGNEKDLEQIASDCQVVATELLDALAKLESKHPRTKWRSFRLALQSAWSEGKVKSLESRLDRFRQQLMVNVLNSLRREAKRSIQEQILMRESLERVEQLQRNTISVGDLFIRKVMEGERWRNDLLQMIHEQGQADFQNADLASTAYSTTGAPDAVVVQNWRVRERVMRKLAYKNMTDRERRICKAHQRTFEWIFKDPKPGSKPWSSFKYFMEHEGEIYWITGKPGSGKSTLMKYIRHHPQTASLLRTWSGNDPVIQAAYYFWNSGSKMQMSVIGLLQTALHNCLQQLPEAVQAVLPERWEAATLFDVDDFPWSLEEIAQALRRLVTEVCPGKKFFIMIDGLDECAEDQTQLIELIEELAQDTSNLKLCVASRPWNNFEDAFKSRPSLRLQDLTSSDIEHYIKSKFTANEGFAEFLVLEPSKANELMDAISIKAEGVFLWVHLVVQSLLEGLTNGDGIRDLRIRLAELPPKLEDLYTKILKSLEDKYLDHASRIFQIVRACDDSPTLKCIALADLEDTTRAMQAPVKPIPEPTLTALCKNMKRKLSSRCGGLLEVSLITRQRVIRRRLKYTDSWQWQFMLDFEDSQTDSSSEDETDGSGCEASIADLEVQFLHRSVRDYILDSEIWSWLVSINAEHFNPHLSLLKANLLLLKGLDPASLSGQEMGFHVWMAIKYAKRSLNAYNEEDETIEVVSLLDELDRAAIALTSPSIWRVSTFTDRIGALDGYHWSFFFLTHTSNPTFLCLMAVCGIHQYLEFRHQRSESRNKVENMKERRANSQKPLLIEAVSATPNIPQIYGYGEMLGPHIEVIKTLLKQGEDCHKRHGRESAWERANRAEYYTIVRLFEEYSGKPRSPPSHENSKGDSSNDKKDCKPLKSSSVCSGISGVKLKAESDTSTKAVVSLQR
jgi:Cdc6-like AAA superfamily ATPase